MINHQKPTTSDQRNAIIMVLINCLATPTMLSASNVALPTIATKLSLTAVMLSWVPMAYLMANAIFILIFARIADMIGRKRVFLWGAIGVIVTSIFTALSSSGEVLILMRFLQGVCAAMLYATQIAIIVAVSPPEKRGRMIGLTVSLIYGGLAVGPLLGGLILDYNHWRAVFLLHIPLSCIVLWLGFFKVKGEWQVSNSGGFDSKGAITYALSITLLCMGISLLPKPWGFLFLAAASVGAFMFIKACRENTQPLFNVNLFFSNKLFSLYSLSSLIIYMSTYANVVLISLYIQYLKDYSASIAGLIMMIQPITMAAFSPVAGYFADRCSPRAITLPGIFCISLGLALLAALNTDSSLLTVSIALVIVGIGFSLFSSPNITAMMACVQKNQIGNASATVGTMRILGQLSSMILITLIFSLIIGSVAIEVENYPLLQKSISLSFSIAALLCFLVLITSLLIAGPGSLQNNSTLEK